MKRIHRQMQVQLEGGAIIKFLVSQFKFKVNIIRFTLGLLDQSEGLQAQVSM